MDIFNKYITPMLLKTGGTSFDDENFIFEIKYDGVRCLVFCDKDKTVLKNRHGKVMNDSYPELLNIHKQVSGKCILDGEIVFVNKKGIPDFEVLQRRILNVSNSQLLAKKYPVSIVIFDILYLNSKDLTSLPLLERKAILNKTLKEDNFVSISKFIKKSGKSLFLQAKKAGLEGIVAKKIDSVYITNKRTEDWIKIKNMQDEDYVICGYTLDESGVRDLILAKDENGKLIYDGTIYIGSKASEKKIIENFAKQNLVKKALFKELDNNIIWLKPTLTCTVEFLERTKTGVRRQPVFKGIRFD